MLRCFVVVMCGEVLSSMGIVHCCMILCLWGAVKSSVGIVLSCGDECCSGYVLSGEGIVSLSIVGVTCCHVDVL